MMNYVGKIVKNTLMFAATGALLALAAPYIAGALGFNTAAVGVTTAASTGLNFLGLGALKATAAYSPLWLGGFFGAFGAISAAISPIFNIFSGGKSHGANGHTVTRSVSYSQAPSMAPELSQAVELTNSQPTLAVNNDALAAKSGINIPAEYVSKITSVTQPDRSV